MSHTLVPVHIKPHLVPFLFKEFKAVDCNVDGKTIKAVKVTTFTHLGRIIRMLLEKTYTKPSCDKLPQIFLQVEEAPTTQAFLRPHFKYVDGRSSFLKLPESGQLILNGELERSFENACMFYIYCWHENNKDQGIKKGIIKFLEKFNLEEYDKTVTSIRRDFYRKLKSGYFVGNIQFNPISQRIETFPKAGMSQ